MLRSTIVVLTLTALTFAQGSSSRTQPTEPKTFMACRAELRTERKVAQVLSDLWAGEQTESNQLRDKNLELAKDNAKLTTENLELTKKYDELRTAAIDVLAYGRVEQDENKKLHTAYESLIDRYNSLLSDANTEIQRANARLARQQQINNSLVMYSLMPKVTYTPLPPPPIFNAPPAVRCTSNTYGSTTYTNCQ